MLLDQHEANALAEFGRPLMLARRMQDGGADWIPFDENMQSQSCKGCIYCLSTADLDPSTTTTYTYDNADRLTGQQVTGARATFVMDAVGNITVKPQEGTSPQTMTYNAAQRLKSSRIGAVTTEFDYDNNGNMTIEDVSGTKTTYAYDRENRMQTMQTASGTSTYAYDGDGLRRRIQDASGTVTIVWDGTDYLGEIS